MDKRKVDGNEGESRRVRKIQRGEKKAMGGRGWKSRGKRNM